MKLIGKRLSKYINLLANILYLHIVYNIWLLFQQFLNYMDNQI